MRDANSYLTLDVDAAERCCSRVLEERASFAGHHADIIPFPLDDMLRAVLAEEVDALASTCFCVTLFASFLAVERELSHEEIYADVGLVSA